MDVPSPLTGARWCAERLPGASMFFDWRARDAMASARSGPGDRLLEAPRAGRVCGWADSVRGPPATRAATRIEHLAGRVRAQVPPDHERPEAETGAAYPPRGQRRAQPTAGRRAGDVEFGVHAVPLQHEAKAAILRGA